MSTKESEVVKLVYFQNGNGSADPAYGEKQRPDDVTCDEEVDDEMDEVDIYHGAPDSGDVNHDLALWVVCVTCLILVL